MERLVFNTAEHKLEELEKYGFVEYFYDTTIYNFKNKIEVCEDENILWFDTDLDDECFCILYDLIKDGLVVKEKKDESKN